MTSLIVDIRENKLINMFNESKVKFTTEQLDLGDIVIKKGEEIVLIIERKSISDLKASICDGRHREQKCRLMGSDIPNERIMFIIEGNFDRKFDMKISGVPISTLVGSIVNTIFRDNLKVYKTNSIVETAQFILKLNNKFSKDLDKFYREENFPITNLDYSKSIKKKKKSNMTPEVWFISQLSLIPQVTILLYFDKSLDTLIEKP